eukprot:gb/GECH01004831.1/.p1 GENE.gb/GECH01004831.1/~~gb/GECH01004831.1/.p1  ORF type:complete len:246 (+),score=20.93 gb/GECH01004831.1/:1-738(+)
MLCSSRVCTTKQCTSFQEIFRMSDIYNNKVKQNIFDDADTKTLLPFKRKKSKRKEKRSMEQHRSRQELQKLFNQKKIQFSSEGTTSTRTTQFKRIDSIPAELFTWYICKKFCRNNTILSALDLLLPHRSTNSNHNENRPWTSMPASHNESFENDDEGEEVQEVIQEARKNAGHFIHTTDDMTELIKRTSNLSIEETSQESVEATQEHVATRSEETNQETPEFQHLRRYLDENRDNNRFFIMNERG